MPDAQHHLKKKISERKKNLAQGLVVGTVKVLISIGLLIWLFSSEAAFFETIGRLKGVQIEMLLLACLPIVISYPLISLRWKYILEAIGYKISFRDAMAISWIGSFFNHTLPTNMVGEFVRVWAIFRRDSSLKQAISSVIIDRIIALFALSVFITVTLPMTYSIMGDNLAWRTLAICGVSILLFILVLLLGDVLLAPFKKFAFFKILQSVMALSQDMRGVLFSSSITLLLVSIVSFIAQALSIWTLALGLGVTINLADTVFLIPPIFLFTTIPISFAGWGLRELAVVTALGFINIPEAHCIAISLSFGFLTLALALPGGLIWLLTRNLRRNRIQ